MGSWPQPGDQDGSWSRMPAVNLAVPREKCLCRPDPAGIAWGVVWGGPTQPSNPEKETMFMSLGSGTNEKVLEMPQRRWSGKQFYSISAGKGLPAQVVACDSLLVGKTWWQWPSPGAAGGSGHAHSCRQPHCPPHCQLLHSCIQPAPAN